ncbi:MAG: FecR domain-containing protein [Polyangiaceae bacterium]
MSELERLGERLRSEQDRALKHEPALKLARCKLERRELERREAVDAPGGVPRRVLWALATVPLALGLGLALRAASGQSEVLTASTGDVSYHRGDALLAPASATLPVDFSDGSSVVLAPSSLATVADLRRHGAELTLATGEAEVHVVHRRHTDWLLNVGSFRVRVTGTRFAVQYDPQSDALELSMTEGSVVVSGCSLGEQGRTVVAHETLRASCRVPTLPENEERAADVMEPATPARPVVDPANGRATRREGSSSRPSAQVVTSEPEWLTLAQSGEYSDAYDQLGPSFEHELTLRGPEELTLMADVARLSGHWDRAEHAYRTLRSRFASTSRAASAAFSLARLAFDQRQSYADAARWFQVYLDEEPSGPFAREALGRRVEALHRAADTRAARSEGARYLQLYPHGPHARAVRDLLAAP